MYYTLIPLFVTLTLIMLMMFANITVNIIFRTPSDKQSKADLRVFIRYIFFTFYILPEKAQKKDKKKKPKVGKKVTEAEKTISKVKENFMTGNYELPQVIELIKQLAGMLIENFQKHLKLKINSFIVTVATDDAQKTALTYGTVTQLTYYLYEFLNRSLKISYDDIKIYSDFTKTSMSYDINMKFSIRLWHALKMAISAVIKYQNIDKNSNDEKK